MALVGTVAAAAFFLAKYQVASRVTVVVYYVAAWVLLVAIRFSIRATLRAMGRSGRRARYYAVVGSGPYASELVASIRRTGVGAPPRRLRRRGRRAPAARPRPGDPGTGLRARARPRGARARRASSSRSRASGSPPSRRHPHRRGAGGAGPDLPRRDALRARPDVGRRDRRPAHARPDPRPPPTPSPSP